MAISNPWPTIHAQREALLADLETLSDQQWNTQSLCERWSVQDVLGHMTATAKMTQPKFFVRMAGSGFRFEKMVGKGVVRERGADPAESLTRFRAQLGRKTKPPGPIMAMVGEAVIHSEDIRRPLGIVSEYPTDVVIAIADFYRDSNLIVGAKRRIAGVKLQATDSDWSSGEGAEVRGPILPLLLVMVGRKEGLQDISGEGVEILRSRR